MKSIATAVLLICGAYAAEQPPVEKANGGEFAPIGGVGAPSGQAAPVEHPDFIPYPDPEDFSSAALYEQFSAPEAELLKKWRVSNAKKADDPDQMSFVGKWAIEEPTVFAGFKGDKGLVLKTPAAHHAISQTFDAPLTTEDMPLVVQYEVKFQDGLQCGGAYVKLLGEHDDDEFSNATPYVVMFGPDKCGATDKVHLIIKRRTTGEAVEHHLNFPPRTQPGKLSNLYTLVISPDQTYEIRVNGVVNKAGSLLEELAFSPPFSPPKEIDDVNDKKPADWVDDEMIEDPAAEKPEDWDEDAPFAIPDPEATKPADWLDDVAQFIPDPKAVKPAGWDDEEDGEWVAPEVPNPACESSGCGPWSPPQIKNPAYKGIWSAPLVENPDYKGEWAPRKVPNPDYFEDATPAHLDPISGIGLELWTMQANILFDNFYVGNSVHLAELLGNATWGPKFYVEQQELKAHVPEPSKGYSYLEHFKAAPVQFMQDTLGDFIGEWRVSPMGALEHQPIAAAIAAGTLLVGSTLLFGLINALLYVFSGKQIQAAKPKPKPKGKAEPAEPVVPADSSAVDPAAGEIRKRKV